MKFKRNHNLGQKKALEWGNAKLYLHPPCPQKDSSDLDTCYTKYLGKEGYHKLLTYLEETDARKPVVAAPKINEHLEENYLHPNLLTDVFRLCVFFHSMHFFIDEYFVSQRHLKIPDSKYNEENCTEKNEPRNWRRAGVSCPGTKGLAPQLMSTSGTSRAQRARPSALHNTSEAPRRSGLPRP